MSTFLQMRRKAFASVFFAIIFHFSGISATGGPDLYGYIWKDSFEPLGPVYNWIDIIPPGTLVSGLVDDNSVGMIQMGFSFHYYWLDFNAVSIGSNGWISFNNLGNIAHCFPSIPLPSGVADNYVAPFMSDLMFANAGNPGRVYYWSNNVDTFIVSYINAPWWSANPPNWLGSNTFQVIFAKQDSSITFQYSSMDQVNFLNGFCAQDAVIGIENATGTIGLQHSNDVIPVNNYAVKFYYPTNTTYQIQDPGAH